MQIDLGSPRKGGYEGRGFGRHYVWTYRCPAGHEVRMRCNSWRGFRRTPSGRLVGLHPQTGVGAITCPQCEYHEYQQQKGGA